MAKDLKTKQKFIELRAEGWSFDRIAKDLNVHKSTLIEWSRELQEKVQNAVNANMEELYERLRLSRRHRLERFSAQLERMEKELASRDLSDLPTAKIFELMLRLDQVVEAEAQAPEYLSEAECEYARRERKNRTILMPLDF